MKKIKPFHGWTIYQATTENDRIDFANSEYGAYLPEHSPRTMDYPEFCADNVQELIDNILSY